MDVKIIPISIFSLVILATTGCSGGGRVMEAEFSSMTTCLNAMKKKAGGDLNIITDKVDMVSGKFSDGRHFACERVVTGSRGTYIKGWYTVD